jgi:hypothetical protein
MLPMLDTDDRTDALYEIQVSSQKKNNSDDRLFFFGLASVITLWVDQKGLELG